MSNTGDDQKVPTIGGHRVGTSFNPSRSSGVDLIKQKSAELINLLYEQHKAKLESTDGVTVDDINELARLRNKATLDIETAAMYGVKMVTKPLIGGGA